MVRTVIVLLLLLVAEPCFAQKNVFNPAFGFYHVVKNGGYKITVVPNSYNHEQTLKVDTNAILNASDLTDIKENYDSEGRPVINLHLNTKGSGKFRLATGKYTGDRIAIIVQGKVIMAPVVQSEIAGGQVEISGGFTVPEAALIARHIRIEVRANERSETDRRTIAVQHRIRDLDYALLTGDTALLKDLLSDQLRFIHSNGWEQTKKAAIADLVSGKLDYTHIEITKWPLVKLSAGGADVTRALSVRGKVEGTAFEVMLQVKESWVYRQGKWILLYRKSEKIHEEDD